jgi:tetratricopeptide (TPR) repeat protein
MRISAIGAWAAGLSLSLLLAACGGGSGLGPQEIKKREQKLLDRLPIDWSYYNRGDQRGSIGSFTQTLVQADALDGVEAIRNFVRSEAQNGIGWSFFRMQQLDSAVVAFNQATRLDRRNADAWVGWAGVSLALRSYSDAVQFALQGLETLPDYDSSARLDSYGRNLAHDRFDERHVHLLLASAYYQLGRYSAADRPDPNNAAAQLRLVNNAYRYRDPGQLLEGISRAVLELHGDIASGTGT